MERSVRMSQPAGISSHPLKADLLEFFPEASQEMVALEEIIATHFGMMQQVISAATQIRGAIDIHMPPDTVISKILSGGDKTQHTVHEILGWLDRERHPRDSNGVLRPWFGRSLQVAACLNSWLKLRSIAETVECKLSDEHLNLTFGHLSPFWSMDSERVQASIGHIRQLQNTLSEEEKRTLAVWNAVRCMGSNISKFDAIPMTWAEWNHLFEGNYFDMRSVQFREALESYMETIQYSLAKVRRNDTSPDELSFLNQELYLIPRNLAARAEEEYKLFNLSCWRDGLTYLEFKTKKAELGWDDVLSRYRKYKTRRFPLGESVVTEFLTRFRANQATNSLHEARVDTDLGEPSEGLTSKGTAETSKPHRRNRRKNGKKAARHKNTQAETTGNSGQSNQPITVTSTVELIGPSAGAYGEHSSRFPTDRQVSLTALSERRQTPPGSAVPVGTRDTENHNIVVASSVDRGSSSSGLLKKIGHDLPATPPRVKSGNALRKKPQYNETPSLTPSNIEVSSSEQTEQFIEKASSTNSNSTIKSQYSIPEAVKTRELVEHRLLDEALLSKETENLGESSERHEAKMMHPSNTEPSTTTVADSFEERKELFRLTLRRSHKSTLSLIPSRHDKEQYRRRVLTSMEDSGEAGSTRRTTLRSPESCSTPFEKTGGPRKRSQSFDKVPSTMAWETFKRYLS